MSKSFFHRYVKVVITTTTADYTIYLSKEALVKESIEMFKLSNGISEDTIINTEVSYITNYLKNPKNGND